MKNQRSLTLCLPLDQYDNILSGYIYLDKKTECYQTWQRLRQGDVLYVAPVSVPFRLYRVKVSGVGISPNRREGGLIIYVHNPYMTDNIKTDLYNLTLFSKSTKLNPLDSENLKKLCHVNLKQIPSNCDDIFPIKLPSKYQLDIAKSVEDVSVIDQMSKNHTFGMSQNSIHLLLKKDDVIVGASSIHVRDEMSEKGPTERRIFGPSLKYLINRSVYIDRAFSIFRGAAKHRVYKLLHLGVFQICRDLFRDGVTFAAGHSYELLPSAYLSGCRVELPSVDSGALYYWKSFLPLSDPMTQREFSTIKRGFRALQERRRKSSSWLAIASEKMLSASLENRIWLISNKGRQASKWQRVRDGDLLYLADRDANMVAVAKLEGKSKKKIRGYEKYPLSLNFSKVYRCNESDKVHFSKIVSWLQLNHSGGISSIPLEVSLFLNSELKIRNGGNTMYVNPNKMFLPGVDFDIVQKQIFVVQSWRLRETVLPAIRLVCDSIGYTVQHAEDRDGMVVFNDIWRLMNESEIVLVDFTDQRPNVYLEFGMALVLGKPIVVISQTGKDIPSDAPNVKWKKYSESKAVKDFREILPGALKYAIEDAADQETSSGNSLF